MISCEKENTKENKFSWKKKTPKDIEEAWVKEQMELKKLMVSILLNRPPENRKDLKFARKTEHTHTRTHTHRNLNMIFVFKILNGPPICGPPKALNFGVFIYGPPVIWTP